MAYGACYPTDRMQHSYIICCAAAAEEQEGEEEAAGAGEQASVRLLSSLHQRTHSSPSLSLPSPPENLPAVRKPFSLLLHAVRL